MSIEKFEEKILKTTSSTKAISRQPIPIRCLATFSVKTRILMEERRLRILYMKNLASTTLQHFLQCQSKKSFLLPDSNLFPKKITIKAFEEISQTFFNFLNSFTMFYNIDFLLLFYF